MPFVPESMSGDLRDIRAWPNPLDENRQVSFVGVVSSRRDHASQMPGVLVSYPGVRLPLDGFVLRDRLAADPPMQALDVLLLELRCQILRETVAHHITDHVAWNPLTGLKSVDGLESERQRDGSLRLGGAIHAGFLKDIEQLLGGFTLDSKTAKISDREAIEQVFMLWDAGSIGRGAGAFTSRSSASFPCHQSFAACQDASLFGSVPNWRQDTEWLRPLNHFIQPFRAGTQVMR